METFATPYQLYYHDGEQEHEKGAIGIHSVLSFKRFQSILSQKTGVPASQLSSVFVCRRTVGDSDKRQKLPINENTNFNIILNQHNPSREKDCHFLVVLKKSKKERKAPRRKSIEIDNNEEDHLHSPDTKSKLISLASEASSPGTAESSPAPSPMLSPSPSLKQLYSQASPALNSSKVTASIHGVKATEAKGSDRIAAEVRTEPATSKAASASPLKSSWQNGSTLQRISGFSVSTNQKVDNQSLGLVQSNLKQTKPFQTSPAMQNSPQPVHEQDSRHKNRLRGSLLQQFNAEKMKEIKEETANVGKPPLAVDQEKEERGSVLDEKVANSQQSASKTKPVSAIGSKPPASKPSAVTTTESTYTEPDTIPMPVSEPVSSVNTPYETANGVIKVKQTPGSENLAAVSKPPVSHPIPASKVRNVPTNQANTNGYHPHTPSSTPDTALPPFASSVPTYMLLSRTNNAAANGNGIDKTNANADSSMNANGMENTNGNVNVNVGVNGNKEMNADQFSVNVNQPVVRTIPTFQQQQQQQQQHQHQHQQQQHIQNQQFIHFNGVNLHYHQQHQHQPQPQLQQSHIHQEFSSPYFSFSAPEISGFAGMMNGVTDKDSRMLKSSSVCKFCVFCRERNIPTPPFHWCVDDRVIVGSKGPSPAGPIGRPGKRHVEAAA